jgi:TrmH family RNA methyltransferase
VTVSGSVLAAMSPVRTPSGVVALARRRPATLDAVFARTPPFVLILTNVQDPGNLGAIVRAAEGCGATGIVTGPGTADPFGWKALRGSMGSTLRIPVAVHQPISRTIETARERGLRIYAAVPRGGTPLPASALRGPIAVLLGGEGGGIPDDLVGAADETLTIPMQPPVESLNVAIAAALIAYERMRQQIAVQS